MPAYHQLRAWAVLDDPIRIMLHQLKYRRNMSLADTLAQAMTRDVMEMNLLVDLVIPIPLGEKSPGARL